MRLIAAVITYYPDVCDATKNIEQYIEHVDTLIIWENTPEVDRNKYKITLPKYEDKIIYMGTGKNEGIGYPLNRIVEYSRKNGYTHLLTMDQDSFFVDFETYKNTVCRYNDTPDIGIFSPNVNNLSKSENEIKDVIEAITSGTIYKLGIFSDGLRFREDFFIDMVDNEFCYNAYRSGIRIVVLINCLLKQKFGDTKRYLFQISSSNYSAFRIYHITRNFIITWKEYPDIIQNKNSFIPKAIIIRAIKIVLFEPDKFKKLKALYLGIIDGLSNKLPMRKL